MLCTLVFVLLNSACGSGDGAGHHFEVPVGADIEGFPYPIGTAEPHEPLGSESAVKLGEAELSEAIAAANALSRLFMSASWVSTCGLRPTGQVECWGEYEPAYARPEGVYRAISGSHWYRCGLHLTGEVSCWDPPFLAETPGGKFSEISAAWNQACGVRVGGSVECWGEARELAEGVVPPVPDLEFPGGKFASVSVGGAHVCGLRPNGEAACWGTNWFAQADATAGPFVAVDAGASHTCGLRPDGSVECWGQDSLDAAEMAVGGFEFGGDENAYKEYLYDGRSEVSPRSAVSLDLQGIVPEPEVREEMARRAQDWSPPEGPFVQVSAGYGFSCGLRFDGEAECWGYFAREEPRIPLEVYAQVYGPRLWDFYSSWESLVASGEDLAVKKTKVFDPRFYGLYESLYGTRVWELDPDDQLIRPPHIRQLESLITPLKLIDPPPGPFIVVEAGRASACGLRPTGEVECWGRGGKESAPPPGPFATEPITGQ